MSKPRKTGLADVRPFPSQKFGFQIHHRSEADLRSGLAELASLYGWDVEEEVVVPGWGRIDIVLRPEVGAKPYLVELKRALTKPSEVRRAFQQADGYGRWWAKERGEANTPLLVANAPNMSIILPVADAYPAVPFRTIDAFIRGIYNWDLRRERFRVANLNVEILRDQLEKYERALAHLSDRLRRADEAGAYDEHERWAAADAFPPGVDF